MLCGHRLSHFQIDNLRRYVSAGSEEAVMLYSDGDTGEEAFMWNFQLQDWTVEYGWIVCTP
jgi:hypothetical protein